MIQNKKYGAIAGFLLAIIFGLIVKTAYDVYKSGIGERINSIGEIPEFMVSEHFAVVSISDLNTLRTGVCAPSPVEAFPFIDGTTLLACGTPLGSRGVRLFTVSRVDDQLEALIGANRRRRP